MSKSSLCVGFQKILTGTPLQVPRGITRVVRAGPLDQEKWHAVINEIFYRRLPERIVESYFNKACVLLFEGPDKAIIGIGGWRGLGGDKCQIAYIGVKQAFRRKGYGTFIVQQSENSAFQAGMKQMFVETTINRPDAVKLYFRLGFCCVSIKVTTGISLQQVEALRCAEPD